MLDLDSKKIPDHTETSEEETKGNRLIPEIYNEQVVTIKIMEIKDAVYEVNMESDHLP